MPATMDHWKEVLERENTLVEQKRTKCLEQMERHKQRMDQLEQQKAEAKQRMQRYGRNHSRDHLLQPT
jgi:hypothetical protein